MPGADEGGAQLSQERLPPVSQSKETQARSLLSRRPGRSFPSDLGLPSK